MTDLHTHILPGMDDGSRTVEESLKMLQLQARQGVSLVCLTPHFSPGAESADSFLARRQRSFEALQEKLPADAPQLVLGAEVEWFPTIGLYEALQQLRLGDSPYFLLELPFQKWTGKLLQELYRLEDSTGLTPILAHVERYFPIQEKARMQELLELGLPMQINASSVVSMGRKALTLLRQGEWLLGSDCHNLTTRPPDLAAGAAYIRKKLGAMAEDMLHWTPDFA